MRACCVLISRWDNMGAVAYILVFGVLAALSASAVWGLWWAMKTGQFAQIQQGAASIFDEEEPIGRKTDAFPTMQNSECRMQKTESQENKQCA